MVALKDIETKEELKNYIIKSVNDLNKDKQKDAVKEYIQPVSFLLKLFMENPSEALHKKLEPFLGNVKGLLGKESYSVEAITTSILDGSIYKVLDIIEGSYKDNFSWRLMESYTEYENVYLKVNFILSLVNRNHSIATA